MSRKTTLTMASVLIGALIFCLHIQSASAQTPATPQAKVSAPTKFMRTEPLRDMRWSLPPLVQRILHYEKAPITATRIRALRKQLIESGELPASGKIQNLPPIPEESAASTGHSHAPEHPVHDPIIQHSLPAAAATAGGFTQPFASFDGLGHSTGLQIEYNPPDANAAVGEKYVIEMVNASFGVFDKQSGKMILGPVPNNALWTGFGGPCEKYNGIHPAVVYDQLAHRWILSHYASDLPRAPDLRPPTYQCIAVSQTDDPTGAWYLYAFKVTEDKPPTAPPGMAVWPDAWYSGDAYAYIGIGLGGFVLDLGEVFTAFDRAAMLAGDPDAQMVSFDVQNPSAYDALPASLDGYNPPPAGAPGLFISSAVAGNFFRFQVLALRQLKVNWKDPSKATLSNPATIKVAPYTKLCPPVRPRQQLRNRNCLVQPSTPQKLDAVNSGLIYRATYRNLGSHQALVVDRTVSVDKNGKPPAGIRWYELDAPKGASKASAWTIAQQSTFAPAAASTGVSRWLGSLAMDHMGNIALGYSLVGPDTDPSVVYTGRYAVDPAGKMTEQETVLQAGGGSQTGTYLWGNVSSMAVAPDDCSFWYTNEYYHESSPSDWSTHVGAFRFPDCMPAAQGTLEGTVTDAASGQPIANAKVILNGNIVAKTDSQGHYSIKLLAESYTLTTKVFGYAPGSGSATVSAGSVTEQDLQLSPAPMATVSGKISDGSGHGWGLYAEIKVFTPDFGQVADVWTDPNTGAYSVKLPQGSDYTLHATAYVNSYQPGKAAITDLSGDLTQNFALKIDGSCTTPGYNSFKINQNFNDGFPPDGWKVTNKIKGSPVVWKLNTQWKSPSTGDIDGNYTGGSGTAADIDGLLTGTQPPLYEAYKGDYDSSLISPPFAVTSLPAQPVLRFLMNFQAKPASELDVDIRADDGKWQTVAAYITTNYYGGKSWGGDYALPGVAESYNLSEYIPQAARTVQLRWRYHKLSNTVDNINIRYAQIDDVRIGQCALIPGGLVRGQVTDKNTGNGVAGATVSDGAGTGIQSIENSADPNLPAGYYSLFVPTGKHTLKASKRLYQSAEKTVKVAANGVKEEDFALGAGRINNNPASLDVHVTVNGDNEKIVNLKNVGSGSAHYRIVEANRPHPPATAAGHAAALLRSSGGPRRGQASKFNLCSSVAGVQCAARYTSWASAVAAPAAGTATDTVVNTFFTFLQKNYGLGFNRDAKKLWIGSISFPSIGFDIGEFLYPGNDKDYQFLPDGTPTGATIDVSGISTQGFEADMAYDDNTGMFWQIGISLNSGFCIYELDPIAMKATGRRICPDIDHFETALAYDPTTNTWYSGDFNTDNVYHFDSSGRVLDFGYQLPEPINGLTYNPATGHLFATPQGAGPVGVFDVHDGYKLVGTIPVPPLAGLAGAGLGHDCAGHLFMTNLYSGMVIEAESGEAGWCDFKQVPWLTESSASGTIAAGASAKVTLDFDGSGRTPFTTTHSRIQARNDTPYGSTTIPVTVHWDARPVDLALTGNAAPSPAKVGNDIAYTLMVKNQESGGDGAATETELTYALPAGTSYVSGSGDGVTCAGPMGSSPTPAAASTPQSGTAVCDLGTLAQGASKMVTIAIKANEAGKLASTFKVSARESDGNTSNNTLTLTDEVLGAANVNITAGSATTLTADQGGALQLSVGNEGPDMASDVKLTATPPSMISLQSVTASEGSCTIEGSKLDCDLGNVAKGETVTVKITAFAASVGEGALNAQVSTASSDPDSANNRILAQVTVEAASSGGGGNGGGGGGGFGWLGLAVLFALALIGTFVGRHKAKGRCRPSPSDQSQRSKHGFSPRVGAAVSTAKGAVACFKRGESRSERSLLRHSHVLDLRNIAMRKGWAIGLMAGLALVLAGGLSAQALAQGVSAYKTHAGAVSHASINPVPRVKLAPQSSFGLLAQANEVGPHAKGAEIMLTFGLKLRHKTELNHFLERVQNPQSADYHHFLTAAEFTARYGPSKQQVAKVEKFLKRWGIEVTGVSADRLLIRTRASTKTYEHALEIRISDYRLNGRSFYSTEDRPRLPKALAGVVANVMGLNHGVLLHPMSHFEPLPANWKRGRTSGKAAAAPRAAATYAAPPATTQYFNPHQIARAYDWPDIGDKHNGAGVTIAILTADSANLSAADYQAFWTNFGLPDHQVTIIPVDGSGSATDGTVESLLDIEYSGAMAPGAALDVYVVPNAQLSSFVDMYDQFTKDNNAQVMSTSWGAPESAGIAATTDAIFKKAAAQGISMFAAAGDNGASDCAPPPGACPPGNNNADYPSVSAYITSANGTELTVSDTKGDYGSEHAWSDTGGAVSTIIKQPDWQVGPNVPVTGFRMNSDLAMNAGPLHPYLLVVQEQWGLVDGTSAVAPQLAGLFAAGISENNGDSYGQSNKLIYDVVNANVKNYGTDFRDVTSGCNGALADDSPSCAEVGWDHPTGFGSPKATSLLSHLGVTPTLGTLNGTVTDAASGTPIEGAEVRATPGIRYTKSNDKGKYSLQLPAGDYTISANAFGYQIGTATVTITKGAAATQDFQLQPQPRATISGRVTDGSGHGWGLYAEITATTPGFGEVADVWTNPKTGTYSIKLPEGYQYTLDVTPYFDYEPRSAKVKLKGDVKHDFVLLTPACDAPGYHFGGITEDFNGWPFPPDGWTVENDSPNGNNYVDWFINELPPQITVGSRWNDPNWTGGSARAAEASDSSNGFNKPFDHSLVSPEIPVSGLPDDPQLSFRLNYQHENTDALDVDIRADGGVWKTIKRFSTSQGGFHKLPGVHYKVGIAKFIPTGATNIQLRWRYYNKANGTGWYAQVDDVQVGGCSVLSGGLVEGQITDKNTGDALVGATVSNDAGGSTKTIENAADADLPQGYYFLFAPAGNDTLTASNLNYSDTEKAANVTNNSVRVENIAVAAGRLAKSPASLDIHVPVGGTANKAVTLQNTGSALAKYELVEANEPVPPPTDTYAARLESSVPLVGHGSTNLPLLMMASCHTIGGCRAPHAAPAVATGGGPGSIVSEFGSGFLGTYGLGVDRDAQNLWLGSISLNGGGDDKDHQLLFDGTTTGKTIDVSSFSPGGFEADMAFDDNTGTLWQIGSEDPSEFCIHEIDPASAQLTRRKICPTTAEYQSGLAYDPLTNTWYSGDFNTDTIYHFDSSGKVLDFKNMGIQISGLTYNPSTGHLFATVSNPTAPIHDVYVIDPKSSYKVVGSFSISGLNGQAGAGLGHDCAGHLWLTNQVTNQVYEVESGESGWCAFRQITWLSVAPANGSVATGNAATVTFDIDGSGKTPFTTSHARVMIRTDTPYGTLRLPVTVYWDAKPADLALSGGVSPSQVNKGDNVVYTLMAKNKQADGHGAATNTTLSYKLPDGVSYISGSGDGVSCAAPTGGTTVSPATASAPTSGTVSCNLGTIAAGASKTATIAVKAIAAGTLTSTFKVSSRESDGNADNNKLTLTNEVIGDADANVVAGSPTSLTIGDDGTVKLNVGNGGPDTASGVTLTASSPSMISLQSATASQGNCNVADGKLDCDLGDVVAGDTVTVAVNVKGKSAGSGSVSASVSTTSADPNSGNNAVSAAVTVNAASSGPGGGKSNGGGGGGALGWLVLAALFGLVLAIVGLKYRTRRA